MTTISPDISIAQIRADLAGQAIGPDDPGYDEGREVFLPQVDSRPAVIVRPADAGEVAYVVRLARESGLELAVRSGGHSGAGHGVSDGGIVLDLSSMKALDVDPVGRVAWAGTGLTAGEVTSALGEHRLAVGFGPWAVASATSSVSTGSRSTTCSPLRSSRPTDSCSGSIRITTRICSGLFAAAAATSASPRASSTSSIRSRR